MLPRFFVSSVSLQRNDDSRFNDDAMAIERRVNSSSNS
jgi:hypothetical protein